MTMIARVADGLPLAASMQEDEQVKFKQQVLNSFSFQFYQLLLTTTLHTTGTGTGPGTET